MDAWFVENGAWKAIECPFEMVDHYNDLAWAGYSVEPGWIIGGSPYCKAEVFRGDKKEAPYTYAILFNYDINNGDVVIIFTNDLPSTLQVTSMIASIATALKLERDPRVETLLDQAEQKRRESLPQPGDEF